MKNPNHDVTKRLQVPVWNQDNKYYEDYQVGEVDRSIRRTISEGEMMLFNCLLLDMHPYVGDEIFATKISSASYIARLYDVLLGIAANFK